MIKFLICFLISIAIFTYNPLQAWANIVGEGQPCNYHNPQTPSQVITNTCEKGLICKIDPKGNTSGWYTCMKPEGIEAVIGQIETPKFIQNIGFGSFGISNFLNKSIALIYFAAGIVFLFMILLSGFQWLVSGGDKEAVGKARARLTYAIIGIAVLAFAFVIAAAVGQILGTKLF